jgi:hypothetical protein
VSGRPTSLTWSWAPWHCCLHERLWNIEPHYVLRLWVAPHDVTAFSSWGLAPRVTTPKWKWQGSMLRRMLAERVVQWRAEHRRLVGRKETLWNSTKNLPSSLTHICPLVSIKWKSIFGHLGLLPVQHKLTGLTGGGTELTPSNCDPVRTAQPNAGRTHYAVFRFVNKLNNG